MTPDQVTALAEQAGIAFQSHRGISGRANVTTLGSQPLDAMLRFAALVAAAEREACATACEDVDYPNYETAGGAITACAAAIRARGTA